MVNIIKEHKSELYCKIFTCKNSSVYLVFGIFTTELLQVIYGSRHRIFPAFLFIAGLIFWMLLVGHVQQYPINNKELFNKKFFSDKCAIVFVIIGLCIACCVSPATSKDVNSYSLYGQMIERYNENPYEKSPHDFYYDQWFGEISLHWSDSKSVYGPLFTGFSTAIVYLGSENVELTKKMFQIVSALCVFVCVLMLSACMPIKKASVLIGLNPMILIFGVNDAHCDVMLGMFLLAGTIILIKKSESFWSAYLVGFLFACATSIKITAILAMAGLALWYLKGNQIKNFFASCAVFTSTVIILMIPFGINNMLSSFSQATGRHSRFSVWNFLHQIFEQFFSPQTANKLVAIGSLAVVLFAWLIYLWKIRKQKYPQNFIFAGMFAYILLGAYVLSWYVFWTLPALVTALGDANEQENKQGISFFFYAMFFGSFIALSYLSGWLALVVLVFTFLKVLKTVKKQRKCKSLCTKIV